MTATSNRVLVGFVAMLIAVVFMSRGSQNEEVSSNPVCPGSPASVHARCEMKVSFPGTQCQKVLEEVTARLNHENGWVDPHNKGNYALISSKSSTDEKTGKEVNLINASHTTGNGKYTDLLNLQLTVGDDGDCVLETCSESQVTSVLDFSTNFCNLHNLYCNDNESCNSIHNSLDYKEDYENCSQNSVSKCSS
eukprot:CAMPEP_0113620954 /NCGR_PEP_ID=MMETSP0017_2-20120614/10691_1 /TAXON_ID=2856 /ORGANISM="Cylindrotheca closterium" /LENGTH=192 /DNA_ID=CAMNT_0000530655 /DNA_START=53 /DNA_END=631 /DNA_ORIENTATION=+ /assembly_acc=CAM_ASM_000147